jgi:hypothetical protein
VFPQEGALDIGDIHRNIPLYHTVTFGSKEEDR